jgi:hypothetical protein
VPERACKAGALPAELHAHSGATNAHPLVYSQFFDCSNSDLRSIQSNNGAFGRKFEANHLADP